MVAKKLIKQDKDSKRYYIVPDAFNKIISKDAVEGMQILFSEFYFIVIKALNTKI